MALRSAGPSTARQRLTACAVFGALLGPAAGSEVDALALALSLGGGAPPNATMFPRILGHYVPPMYTEVVGPKSTNKFWANWVVGEGIGQAIYPMPFALQWRSRGECKAAELMISHGEPQYTYVDGGARIQRYSTPFVNELALGTVEDLAPGGHAIVSEGLFGIHVEVRGAAVDGVTPKVMYPIFSGMAYISARYEALTPKLAAVPRVLSEITKVQDGIWTVRNDAEKEFRVYALTKDLSFVDDSFDFDSSGALTKPLDGWLRVALVSTASDTAALDAHARAILMDADMQVLSHGHVDYQFTTQSAPDVPLLHFAYAHHVKLFDGPSQALEPTLAPVRAPTKGEMRGVVGDAWRLSVDLSQADSLGFLPEGEVAPEHEAKIRDEVLGTLEYFKEDAHWRGALLRRSYYFSGKGFQKLATVCLLAEKFFGKDDEKTQACAKTVATAFRCLYDPENAGDCRNAPEGSYYDEMWGGLPSREGFFDGGCLGRTDFGNACYNDHHYHYGYFVVSAAILVKLVPSMADDVGLVTYVNSLIRDTANPNSMDEFFPRFRSFDWFDLHSWSRGVGPSADGKDQESTSEELNLLYGIYLWGGVMHDRALRQLGATMVALCSVTIQEFFLMEDGNPHHPEGFVKNRVTGIFFQNRVDYTTWFGGQPKYIHSIQMLPLTPALLMARTPTFCKQEWDDIVSKLTLSPTDHWTSILLTGSMAMVHPQAAYERILQIPTDRVDDGLTRAHALYWAAALAAPPPTAEASTSQISMATTTLPITAEPSTTAALVVTTPAPTTALTTTAPTTTTTAFLSETTLPTEATSTSAHELPAAPAASSSSTTVAFSETTQGEQATTEPATTEQATSSHTTTAMPPSAPTSLSTSGSPTHVVTGTSTSGATAATGASSTSASAATGASTTTTATTASSAETGVASTTAAASAGGVATGAESTSTAPSIGQEGAGDAGAATSTTFLGVAHDIRGGAGTASEADNTETSGTTASRWIVVVGPLCVAGLLAMAAWRWRKSAMWCRCRIHPDERCEAAQDASAA